VIAGEHQFFEDSEWQANAMAAALLMPIEACRKSKNATQLAKMCGTSAQAAQYRLERLIKRGILPSNNSLF
jgi:Zn-dependent peptidase ImmA (M78 family)